MNPGHTSVAADHLFRFTPDIISSAFVCCFRVRVAQQRSPLAELLAEESKGGETRDSNFLEEEDHIFNWQEKVFGPFEIDFYADEKNCLSDCQKEYHRRINDEQLKGARLYSYTENDSYYIDDNLLTTPYRSYLSKKNQTALPAMQNRKPFRERYNKRVLDNKSIKARIRSSHYFYTERISMHVMADLSHRDEPATGGSADSETLLCSVIYDKARKQLTIDPDFTIDDERHYSVINGHGVKFNYWIEHVSAGPTLTELQEKCEATRREVQQELAYKEAELYKELQLPPTNLSTLFLNLDIVSAHGFSYDGLFITYFIDLPQQWTTKQKERLFGRTQRCLLENKSAHFSYCTDISLHYPSNDFQQLTDDTHIGKTLTPRLLFSVASLDSWTRYRIEGYAALPIPMIPGTYKFTVPTWRAKDNIIDALRRFFVGGSYELEDITYCSIPMAHEGKVLDKSNLRIISSGDIEINMNIVIQNGIHMKHLDYEIDNSDRIRTDTLMNNVENVLEQFKAAKERMIRIRTINS